MTGSVAERVAPIEKASTKDILNPSRGMRVHRYSIKPRTTAEMKVPAKANVKMVPMFRKKLAYSDGQFFYILVYRPKVSYLVQLISRGEDDWRKKKVKEKLIVKADYTLNKGTRSKPQGKTDNHPCHLSISITNLRKNRSATIGIAAYQRI